jgi:hypothetical protein
VRFRLAADAAFFMFSLATFLCFVEAIYIPIHLRKTAHWATNSSSRECCDR